MDHIELNELGRTYVRNSGFYSEVRIVLISCLVLAASRCLHAAALSYVFLADVALVPQRGQAGSDAAEVRGGAICATTKRRDVVSWEIPLQRTHVVICSKQKRKKR